MRAAKMGECPLCQEDILTDQHTAWRQVDGKLARVHGVCLDPPETRRAVALPPYYDISPAPDRQVVARCRACPWVSEPAPSAGIVGARWDHHRETSHP